MPLCKSPDAVCACVITGVKSRAVVSVIFSSLTPGELSVSDHSGLIAILNMILTPQTFIVFTFRFCMNVNILFLPSGLKCSLKLLPFVKVEKLQNKSRLLCPSYLFTLFRFLHRNSRDTEFPTITVNRR